MKTKQVSYYTTATLETLIRGGAGILISFRQPNLYAFQLTIQGKNELSAALLKHGQARCEYARLCNQTITFFLSVGMN